MAKYKCTKCNKEKTLSKQTIKVISGEVRVEEALCKGCNIYMNNIDEPTGFGTALMRGGKALSSSKSRTAQPSGRIGDEKININE